VKAPIEPHNVRTAALAALAAGMSVVPPRQDGSKAPDREWTRYQAEPPTRDQVERWYGAGRTGLGVVCGRVSGGLELLEFETDEVYRDFVAAARATGLGDLVDLVEAGYVEEAPGGGRHWLYRCRQVEGSTKLARRPATADELAVAPDDRVKTLIETKGEGGYVVVAPSNGKVHPTGRPYRLLRGGFSKIRHLTGDERAALFRLARSFDQMPAPPPSDGPVEPRTEPGGRPGDDFNRRASWAEVLEPHGWVQVYERGEVEFWRRPGKRGPGHSATVGHIHDSQGGPALYVFSSSTPFEPERSYSKFGAYAVLQHGGDHAAAARALRADGYGDAPKTSAGPQKRGTGSPGPSASPGERRDAGRGTGGSAPARRLRLTPASQIPPKPVRWIWDKRLPAGAVALIPGREGIGKSLFLVWLAARLTQGTLPGIHYGSPKPVFYAATEDSWARTIVPRLIVAGADLDLVYRVEVEEDGSIAPLTLPTDCAALAADIDRVGAAMLALDPLMSAIEGGIDTHRDRELRQALEPLAAVADQTGCGVAGLAHFTKANTDDVMNLITGSRAFGAVTRAVIAVARDPDAEDGSCVLSQAKNNLGRLDLPSLRYLIEEAKVDTDEGPAEVGRLRFTGQSDRSVSDILGDQDTPEDRTECDETADWLVGWLTDQGGEAPYADVLKAARADGIAERTLQRARHRAKVTSERGGFPARAYWRLPVTPQSHQSRQEPDAGGTGGTGATASAAGGTATTQRDAETAEPNESAVEQAVLFLDDHEVDPSTGGPLNGSSNGPARSGQCGS
jgi:hypothetical protein